MGDSNAAWETLSTFVHDGAFKAFDGGEVHVPSTLPPTQTRFLVRLYQGQGHKVKILLVDGRLRDPIVSELKTPPRGQDDSVERAEQSESAEKKKKKKKKGSKAEAERRDDESAERKKKKKKKKESKAESEELWEAEADHEQNPKKKHKK